MTKVINLYGGPGTGKSTTAAEIFVALKKAGLNVEMAHEYAKDLTWEDRRKAIRFQPYVCVKQMWRVHRLLGQVDAVITDSPILLSTVYGGEGYSAAFEDFVIDTYRGWDTLNYLLVRDSAWDYKEVGRFQTKFQAEALDSKIEAMLVQFGVDFAYSHSTADILDNLLCLLVN